MVPQKSTYIGQNKRQKNDTGNKYSKHNIEYPLRNNNDPAKACYSTVFPDSIDLRYRTPATILKELK